MILSDEKIMEIIKSLQGSCQSVEDMLVAHTDGQVSVMWDIENEDRFCQLLDDNIFLCEVCNWWCPVEEMTETQECSDCTPEDDDE